MIFSIKKTFRVIATVLIMFVFAFNIGLAAMTTPYVDGINGQSTNGEVFNQLFPEFAESTQNQAPVITPTASKTTNNSSGSDCSISARDNKYNYCMLAPLNGLLGEEKGILKLPALGEFFSRLYKIGIMAAVALAIVMITLGGIRLGTTDSISGTEKGRDMIKSAIAGLLIALFSYVILYTINPELVLQTNNVETLLLTK